ncbi:MAG: hypothetical protein OEW30_16265 [Acidimicrobiia bacterium]|nr:hypothetical protein [Acidimicrobiia bacterium]
MTSHDAILGPHRPGRPVDGFGIGKVALLKLGGLLGQMVADRIDRDLVGWVVGDDVLTTTALGVGEDVSGLVEREWHHFGASFGNCFLSLGQVLV